MVLPSTTPQPKPPSASNASTSVVNPATSPTAKAAEAADVPPPTPKPAITSTSAASTIATTGIPTTTVAPAVPATGQGATVPPASSAPSLVALPGTHKAPPTIPTNKRKLHRNVPVTQLLSDHSIIQKTVHNIFGLLESYGPLTVGQLEYNLPPIVGERVNSQSIHDIVQVLVCMGLIHRVRDPPPPTPDSKPGVVVPDTTAARGKPPRYCVARGIPRADVVLPNHILDQITAAHEEIQRSASRRKRLREALASPTGSSPKELLREMAVEYPEILQDPVYVTALKSFQIDVAFVDRERRLRQQQKAPRAAKATAAASKPTNPKTGAAAAGATTLPAPAKK